MKLVIKSMVCSLLVTATVLPAIHWNESWKYEASGHSYLALRPTGQSNTPELVSMVRYPWTEKKEDGRHMAVQLVPYGAASTDSEKLSRYFSPFGKTTLKVKSSASIIADGDAGQSPAQGDILADFFNVFTADTLFESTISLHPKQSVFGFIFHGRKAFWRNDEQGQAYWGSVSFPVQRVKNNVHLREDVTNDGGGASTTASSTVVPDMTAAFNQSAWNFGKIACGSMSKTGVADIEVKVGYEWNQYEPAHLEGYFGILIPTGNTPKGEFLFEPIVGNGHHFGVMWGSAFGLTFYEDESRDRMLRAEFAIHSQYLFEKRQMRSFDVKYKPWSRYMGVYTSVADATAASTNPDVSFAANNQTPGINVFTRAVDVTPGFAHDLNTGVVYSTSKMHAEIGWNYYTRQDESVELACSFPTTIAFKSFTGDGTTSDIRDITGKTELEGPIITLANYETAVIKENQLDLASASSPAFVSHTLYGTVGYKCEKRDYPIIAALGYSYEWTADTNAGVDRWVFWGKVAVSF